MPKEILELLIVFLLYYLIFPLPLLFVMLLIIAGITIWITFRKPATSGTPKDSKAATYLKIAAIAAPLGAGISGLMGFGAICAGSLPLIESTLGQVGFVALGLLGTGFPLAIALGTIGATISAMISRAWFPTFSPFTTAAVVASLIGFLAPQLFLVTVIIYMGGAS